MHILRRISDACECQRVLRAITNSMIEFEAHWRWTDLRISHLPAKIDHIVRELREDLCLAQEILEQLFRNLQPTV
jgi:hypothetical protein